MPTPQEISALASEMPTGGFSAGQIKDIAGSPNATSLIATSKDSRAALPAANTKLDTMIRAQQPSVSSPVTTPTQTGTKTAKDVGLEGNTPSGGVGSKYTSGDGSKWVYTNGGWVPDTGVQNGAQGGSTVQNGTNTVPQTPYEKELSDYAARLEEQKQTLLTADKEWQAKLDSTLSSLVDSIQKKYEARRLKMQDVNARNLEGKRISGITSGRMKYANTMEDNLLSTEELDGQARLAEIDAEEMTLIAQAKQARDEASYNAFYKNMDRLDALSKEKMDTITNLHNAAIAADKALDEKRRNAITEEQAMFNLTQDKASSFAKTAYELMSTMKTDADKEAYLQKLAKDQKLDPEILRGAIDEYGGKQENLQSQIAARESAASAREQSLSIQEQRLALAQDNQAKEYTDGKLTYSDTLVNDAKNSLTTGDTFNGVKYNGMGKDGFVDPDYFKALYDNWIASGGTKAGFLKEFPPNDFVNPKADLPKFLKPELK